MESQIQKNLEACPICKKRYFKGDFVRCDHCNSYVCLNCALRGGKLGTYCSLCLNKLPREKKDAIVRTSKKMYFWAKNGYFMFIALLAAAVFSFSLWIINDLFFFIGAFLAAFTFVFGIKLFKYLTR